MNWKLKLQEIQKNLKDQEIGGWLLYDFHRSNSLAYNFLEIPKETLLTRRFFYWIPQQGESIKIIPSIEPHTLDHLPGIKWLYKGWQELEQYIFSLPLNKNKIAMEYSPNNSLPIISKVDAGTIEWIRQAGAEVVSSANLLQSYTSVWTANQLQSHLKSAKILETIADETWIFIEHHLKHQIFLNEYQVQQFMLQKMNEAGSQTADPPICAVNAHSADPHYFPQSHSCSPISKGDFILLDLWCKQKTPQSVYADITRIGIAYTKANQKQQEIFDLVKKARHQGTLFIKEKYASQCPIQGWEVDQVCRHIIDEAGYGEYFIHRTGHNIGEEVHGLGANLDNLETHDYRQLLAGTGFSVEPGIYLPNEFGVRLEYDIYLDPSGQVCITGGIQEDFVYLS